MERFLSLTNEEQSRKTTVVLTAHIILDILRFNLYECNFTAHLFFESMQE